MEIKAYIYHKRAEKYSDCQDCFGINSQNNRIAVSDGMSQSIFPQWWAKILVEDYLQNGHIPQDIQPLQEKWQNMLLAEIQRREEEAITNPKRDPWRLKNLLAEKSGAGATLCGVTFGNKEWCCECLGDSCVITINHDYTLNIYTSQVGAFNNHPDYFDSFKAGRGTPIRKSINQDVLAILIVTDPFAELFQLHENNRDFIKGRLGELQNLTSHDSFTELVERWRNEFGMHNDDSTLVLIEEIAKSGFYIKHRDYLNELCAAETSVEKNQPTSQYISNGRTLTENVDNSSEDIIFEQTSKLLNEEEAEDQLKTAAESVLSFCPDNKRANMRSIENWLIKHLKSTIKKYLKK